ncbi:hypothetical protein ACFIOY_19675 [Bradyrhizobium sp. TZ2]
MVVSPVLLSELEIRHAMDLTRCPLLHMKGRISAWPDWFRKGGTNIGQTPRGQVFDHFFLSIEARYGIALVPEALVSMDIAERRLLFFLNHASLAVGFYRLFERLSAQSKTC